MLTKSRTEESDVHRERLYASVCNMKLVQGPIDRHIHFKGDTHTPRKTIHSQSLEVRAKLRPNVVWRVSYVLNTHTIFVPARTA